MSHPRKPYTWRCRDRELQLGRDTVIMGVINVTPDSFFDGGQFAHTEKAIARGLLCAEQGAQVLDIGGASSRPGATEVTIEEEQERVMPVIAALAQQTDCLISVDTTRAGVAAAALEAGAHTVNDISALTSDPEMPGVVKKWGAGVVLMHMQGCPQTMQRDPVYDDVVLEVARFLQERVAALESFGIEPARMVVDPGIGFGKRLEHNLALLAGLPKLAGIGVPLLVGLSRKRMIGDLTGREVDDRLAGSLAGLAYAVMQGTHIMRVHDIKESCDSVRMLDILMREEFKGAEYPNH